MNIFWIIFFSLVIVMFIAGGAYEATRESRRTKKELLAAKHSICLARIDQLERELKMGKYEEMPEFTRHKSPPARLVRLGAPGKAVKGYLNPAFEVWKAFQATRGDNSQWNNPERK